MFYVLIVSHRSICCDQTRMVEYLQEFEVNGSLWTSVDDDIGGVRSRIPSATSGHALFGCCLATASTVKLEFEFAASLNVDTTGWELRIPTRIASTVSLDSLVYLYTLLPCRNHSRNLYLRLRSHHRFASVVYHLSSAELRICIRTVLNPKSRWVQILRPKHSLSRKEYAKRFCAIATWYLDSRRAELKVRWCYSLSSFLQARLKDRLSSALGAGYREPLT
jgi:hypothetical protein